MSRRDQTTKGRVIRQGGQRWARFARERLRRDTDRIPGLGLVLPRVTLALRMPISVPTAGAGNKRGPGTVAASLGRGALVDRGDNGLCVRSVVWLQDKGYVGGWRGELRWGRDERLKIGAFGWRRVTRRVTAIEQV